jgi:hypothetical protein
MSSKIVIIFFTLIIFPFIFIDLSIPKIDLLVGVGYKSYSNFLLSLTLLPFIFIKILFFINNKIKFVDFTINKKILFIFFQSIIFLIAIIIVIVITIKLPFANIKFYQFKSNKLCELKNIKVSLPIGIYIRSSSSEGCRLYYKSNLTGIETKIENILLENDMVTELRRYSVQNQTFFDNNNHECSEIGMA